MVIATQFSGNCVAAKLQPERSRSDWLGPLGSESMQQTGAAESDSRRLGKPTRTADSDSRLVHQTRATDSDCRLGKPTRTDSRLGQPTRTTDSDIRLG